jgi:small subunit ribosomal protein S14
MAKKSVIHRDLKRRKLYEKYKAKRHELRAIIYDANTSHEERWEAVKKMQSLPRDTSAVRRRNRCKLCGRPRAYNRLTGLCRLHMRFAIIKGMVPGMRKASW